MVAARAAVSPTMSACQQKLMQYLPVVVRRVPGLLPARPGRLLHRAVGAANPAAVLHHQAFLRSRASRSVARPRRPASGPGSSPKEDGGGGGPLAQARRDLADAKKSRQAGAKSNKKPDGKPTTPEVRPSKRTTAPKNRPTPSAKRAIRQIGRGRPASRPSSPNEAEGHRATRKGRRSDGMGRNDRQRRSTRPRIWPSIGSASPPTTPSSTSSRSHAAGCSGGCAARPGCGPEFMPAAVRPKQERRNRGRKPAERSGSNSQSRNAQGGRSRPQAMPAARRNQRSGGGQSVRHPPSRRMPTPTPPRPTERPSPRRCRTTPEQAGRTAATIEATAREQAHGCPARARRVAGVAPGGRGRRGGVHEWSGDRLRHRGGRSISTSMAATSRSASRAPIWV